MIDTSFTASGVFEVFTEYTPPQFLPIIKICHAPGNRFENMRMKSAVGFLFVRD